MRTLLLDVETQPMTLYAWGLYNQNHSIGNIVQSGAVLCWAAKWLGDENIIFDSVQKSGHKQMLKHIHNLLNEADVVVHYNGLRFDMPTLSKEFVKEGMLPPSPYKNVDLYQQVKRLFRFESNKLDYVAQSLGLGKKVEHRGFELWIDCMKGDKAAFSEMEEYNRQDVVLLENLYFHILPWIPNHPNRSTYAESKVCPNCGSVKYQRRGTAVTRTSKYARYQCKGCGHWFKGSKESGNAGTFRQISD